MSLSNVWRTARWAPALMLTGSGNTLITLTGTRPPSALTNVLAISQGLLSVGCWSISITPSLTASCWVSPCSIISALAGICTFSADVILMVEVGSSYKFMGTFTVPICNSKFSISMTRTKALIKSIPRTISSSQSVTSNFCWSWVPPMIIGRLLLP